MLNEEEYKTVVFANIRVKLKIAQKAMRVCDPYHITQGRRGGRCVDRERAAQEPPVASVISANHDTMGAIRRP